jgi:hypothetical protein
MRDYKKSKVLNNQIDRLMNDHAKRNGKEVGLTFRGRSKQGKRMLRRFMKELLKTDILKRQRAK